MKNKNIETIKKEDDILAIIIYRDYFFSEGTEFFTPDNFSQQLAFIFRKKGQKIKAHKHKIKKRNVFYTQEVLIMKEGRVRVNLYDIDEKYFCSRILGPGDIIFLANGGHGFEFLEDTKIIEVKQGPYQGDDYKIRFKGIED